MLYNILFKLVLQKFPNANTLTKYCYTFYPHFSNSFVSLEVQTCAFSTT